MKYVLCQWNSNRTVAPGELVIRWRGVVLNIDTGARDLGLTSIHYAFSAVLRNNLKCTRD